MFNKNRNKLYGNSLAKLNEMVSEGDAYGNPNEVQLIKICIKFMEELFDEVGYEERKQLEKIQFICPLPIPRRGLYGEMIEISNDEFGIFINPNLHGNGILTPYERTRLYLYHEAFHVIHRTWVLDARDVSSELVQANILNVNQSLHFYEGANLLDEATSQEMAEELAYKMANKRRPIIREIEFCGVILPSNFDFYGEFQQIAGKFAQTLRGIGKFDNSFYALNLLAKRANKGNLINEIVKEYDRDGKFLELINLFIRMGEIKMASYASFGIGQMSTNTIGNSIIEVAKLAESLRDWRERDF